MQYQATIKQFECVIEGEVRAIEEKQSKKGQKYRRVTVVQRTFNGFENPVNVDCFNGCVVEKGKPARLVCQEKITLKITDDGPKVFVNLASFGDKK